MVDKVIKKLNLGIIIFILLYIPMMYTLRTIFLPFFELKAPVYFYVLLYLLMPLYIYIYIYNLIKRKFKINKYDILIYGLILFGIIATINAHDVETSLWGAYTRNEGLIIIICYYLLFLNSRELEPKDVKVVLNCVFFAGITQSIYSILQVFVRGNIASQFTNPYMASGFVGNPNMLGSYCVLLLGISITMYFMYKKRIYFGLSILYFINLVLAQSTGPFFAFVAMLIFLLIIMFIRKKTDVKEISILLLTLIVTFLIVSFGSEIYCEKVFGDKISDSSTIKGDIVSTLNLFLPNSNNGGTDQIIDSYGSGRLEIWKNTIKIVPKYWLTGAGIDNFGYVYPTDLHGMYVDKAHNEYLQILTTEGIFSLIIYLLFYLNLFVDALKSKSELALVLLVGFIGYAMQAFMNIRVTTVAPLFFIVCGMLVCMLRKEKV